MSTRRSIRDEFDDDSHTGFHLYEDLYDEGNVYLELEGFHFEAATLQNLTWENGQPRITIKVPTEWAKKLHLLETE